MSLNRWSVVLLGAGVLLLPLRAVAGNPPYALDWDNASQVLEYRTCGCADSCWVAELRKKKSRKFLVKLKCDCSQLWVATEKNPKETLYRTDCNGFDTEEKMSRIAAEVRTLLEASQKSKAK